MRDLLHEPPSVPDHRGIWEEAYVATQARRDELAERELLATNVNAVHVVGEVSRRRARLELLVEPCRRLTLDTDPACFEDLWILAQAFGVAHIHIQMLGKSRQHERRERARALVKTRDLLLSEARSLTKRGVVPADFFPRMRGAVAYRHLCRDVVVLGFRFGDNLAALSGKTWVTQELLTQALDDAKELLDRLEDTAQQRLIHAAMLERDRAFTLFMRCLGAVTRAVSYLRFHQGDAAKFLPNIHLPHKRPRTRKPRAEASADATPSPAVPFGPRSDQPPVVLTAATAADFAMRGISTR